MALTTINLAKEAEESYQPLLLAEFTFTDSSVLRLSSHPLNTADGGYQYGGNDYKPRIFSWQLGAIQAVAEQGISVVPRVSLTLADPDKFLWTNYEDAKGFKGATLVLTFVFWEVDTATFSSDSIQKFVGICDGSQVDDENLIVTAANKLNLQRKFLPVVPIQRRCPWLFPSTSAERQAAADDEDSKFYRCGYSYDASGGNARGSGTFSDCNYTKSDCEARGMYEEDGSARTTGRFGGIQWDPPKGGRSREYVSGDWLNISNNPNEAKYGEYFPMVYGTAWVDAIACNVVGDGNSTRGEAVICTGQVDDILRVSVNDIELPPASDIEHGALIVQDNLIRWNLVNRGDRDGGPNQDTPYSGNGDPYGSLATIMWVVPRTVAEAESTPRIRVLVKGPQIRVYTGPSTSDREYSENPVWVIMDVLIQVGWEYSDLDIQTFIDAAAVADTSISYDDQYGGSSSHNRYLCSLVLKQRRSAADVVNGLLRSCHGILVPNSATGKLEIHLKQTLADQQGSTVGGSNYDTPISSKEADGTPANGYAAYKFDDSTIRRRDDGRSSMKLWTRPNNDAPNRVSFTFSNSDRDYAGDSLSMIDEAAITRIGQEVVQNLQVDSIPNFDQAKRIAKVTISEGLRGNSREDTGGTIYGELEPLAGFRAIRVRVGHLCLLSDTHHAITDQLIRILKIQPGANFETARITFQNVDDDWYTDAYGQSEDPEFSEQYRDRLARPAFPWAPYKVQPDANDPMYDSTDWTFRLEEQHQEAADGTAITTVRIAGRTPINIFAELRPPLVARQGTTATTGGTIAGNGRVYYIAVCAKDADDKLSPPSLLTQVVVTDAGNTNTITTSVLTWPTGAAGYVAFAGLSPHRLTYQADGATTPSSITLTAYNERAWGMPDVEFDKFALKVKRIAHSGVFGVAVSSVAANTMTVTDAGWTTNEWAGRDCSIIGIAAGGNMDLFNFSVSSNTDDTLTVSPDPQAAGIVTSDVLIMRSTPTVGSDAGGNYLEDALWVNDLAGTGIGLAVDEEIGRLLRIIAGTGRGDPPYLVKDNDATKIWIEGDWVTTPDSTSRYIIEEPEWQVRELTESLNNDNSSADIWLEAPVQNYEGLTLLVHPATLDGGENESLSGLGPYREIYVFGDAGSLGGPVGAAYET